MDKELENLLFLIGAKHLIQQRKQGREGHCRLHFTKPSTSHQCSYTQLMKYRKETLNALTAVRITGFPGACSELIN